MNVWKLLWDLFGRRERRDIDPMAPPVRALCETLERIIELLVADNEAHWSRWMRGALDTLSSGDSAGAHRVLAAYGGMGSFNDLIIGQTVTDDRLTWADGAAGMNDELDALRARAYTLAQQVVDPSS